jgi:hypothetical protein
LKGKFERNISSLVLSGEEWYVVSQYEDIVFGFQSGKQKFPSFCVIHN